MILSSQKSLTASGSIFHSAFSIILFCKVSGATVHFVTAECDAGPIILQKAVEVLEGDTPESLQKRIMENAEWKILPQAVKLFCDDKIIVEGEKTIILK